MKKKLNFILTALFLASALFSCKKSDIIEFQTENSSLSFAQRSNSFSLKGMKDEYKDLLIELSLVGLTSDYDRPVNIETIDSTGVRGVDYEILSAQVDSGATRGSIVIRVYKLAEDAGRKFMRINLVPNEHFRKGISSMQTTQVSWSEEYERPGVSAVWRTWYFFLSHYYSRSFHKVVLDVLGTEIETSYLYDRTRMKEDYPDYTYVPMADWYAYSRKLYKYISEYDNAHPGAPLMHSDDVEYYRAYTLGVGEGEVPAEIPTMLSTLERL